MPTNARGSALITALFIMTLVAIAATAMSSRLQLDIYRTHLTLLSDKLYLTSQAVSFWAMGRLADPTHQSNAPANVGKTIEYPSQSVPAYPGISTKGRLSDLQSMFNINNLQDTRYHALFYRLLENTLKKSTPEERKLLVSSIQHWVNHYQPEHGHDTLLNTYLTKNPPYIPGYQSMQSISELRMVQGMTRKMYDALQPVITALPEVTPININTASKSLLMTLGNGLSDTDIDILLEARGKKGIKNMDTLRQLLQKLDIPADQVTLDSTYFLSVATVESDDLNLTTYTVIKRSKDQHGRQSIGIISEYLNTI